MSVSILVLEKFIFFALFTIIAVRGKHIHMVDKVMCCDLILLFKPLIWGEIAGEAALAGGPRRPFPW